MLDEKSLIAKVKAMTCAQGSESIILENRVVILSISLLTLTLKATWLDWWTSTFLATSLALQQLLLMAIEVSLSLLFGP